MSGLECLQGICARGPGFLPHLAPSPCCHHTQGDRGGEKSYSVVGGIGILSGMRFCFLVPSQKEPDLKGSDWGASLSCDPHPQHPVSTSVVMYTNHTVL